jgi:hypothetical protein
LIVQGTTLKTAYSFFGGAGFIIIHFIFWKTLLNSLNFYHFYNKKKKKKPLNLVYPALKNL